MKKIFCILSILTIANPVFAATGDIINTNPVAQGTQTDAQVTTTVNPKYQMATEADTDNNAASAGYVKGAYNAAIKAVNKVAAIAREAKILIVIKIFSVFLFYNNITKLCKVQSI